MCTSRGVKRFSALYPACIPFHDVWVVLLCSPPNFEVVRPPWERILSIFRRPSYAVCIVLLIAAGLAAPVQAAQLEMYPDQPMTEALRLNPGETIDLDGSLDEAACDRAATAADFTQSDPQYGAPATEPTEIRILFDRDSLYIGRELFDSNPDSMLGNQLIRDGSLDADDRLIRSYDRTTVEANAFMRSPSAYSKRIGVFANL